MNLPTLNQRKLVVVPAFFLFSILCLGLFHRDLPSRLRFPDGADQDVHIESANRFVEHFTFEAKSPLYTAWLSIFCSAARGDARLCFLLEKYTSILLFAFLMSLLGFALFDKRTGLLLGLWSATAKYMIVEPNGSNAFAAILVVLSGLCLCWRNRAALPAALLTLFLATLARPELRVPFFALVAYLIARAIVNVIRGTSNRQEMLKGPGKYYWAGSIALSLLLLLVINNNLDSTRWSISNAFFLGYCVTYVNRSHLEQRYPKPWGSAHEILAQAMPEVKDPIDAPGTAGFLHAVELYPREFLAHVLYNAKLSIRVVPAVMLGVDHLWLLLISIVLYAMSYVLVKGSERTNYQQTTPELWRDLVAWGLSLTLVIPISVVILILWRYYIPLLPVGMIGACYLFHKALDRFPQRRTIT